MNRPIRRVTIAIAVLFVALFVNLNVVQVIQGDSYRDNKDNRRVLLNEYSNPRGAIVVDGRAIASSKKTDDELKYLRTYPGGAAYANITGYYSFVYGTTGLENAENSVLTGDDPKLFTEQLTGLLTGRDPKGGSVQLTLNNAAQQAAYKAMGNRRGAVVALDPKTGAILAAVSTPSYDPNKLSSHDSDAIQTYKASLDKNADQPLLNRAFDQVYPAGSTFKIIDAAAALTNDPKLTPNTVLPAPGAYRPLDPSDVQPCSRGNGPCIANFDNEACGSDNKTATLALSLAKSCNTTFAKLTAETVGGDKIAAEAKKFGLDDPYSGDTPGDLCDPPPALKTPLTVCRSSPGSVDDLAAKDSLAQTAIGQLDVRVTPLQVAMLASAVANNGTLMKPYLVAKELRPNLTKLSEADPEQLSQVIDPTRDLDLINLMEGVVSNPQGTGGTAAITNIDGVKVGGKTGTADHGLVKNGKQTEPPHAWFTGFALYKGDPKIAVAVIVEDGGVDGSGGISDSEITGGKAAGPVAKSVMTAYLNDIGIK